SPVVISNVLASCGCTSLQLGSAAPRNYPLAAGQTVEVRALVNISTLRPGPVQKYVWTYLKGDGRPAATVELGARIKEPVIFTPSNINFERTPAHFVKPIKLTAAIDKRLLVKGITLTPISTNPDVVIRQQGEVKEAGNGVASVEY